MTTKTFALTGQNNVGWGLSALNNGGTSHIKMPFQGAKSLESSHPRHFPG
jgi:hypothetical protein